ncbi:HPr-like protein Crh [bioreactor metagenome]|uniref:HPr-like protein Crh n=1 Tax=bioreactor metagenome TaxID=1076179 RepID=A0A644XUN2_9ZZZZ|nr:HPr family phosphocarrier protein [Candidatus Metalachnospira sp.]
MNKLVSKTIKVKNTLDTRQVAYLVQCAGQFKSDIRIEEDEKRINAKSIMGTISLAIKEDDNITIIADGIDEEKAVEEISKILI